MPRSSSKDTAQVDGDFKRSDLQALASTAREFEQEVSERPSGESPRTFATTPRYFNSPGQSADGTGFESARPTANGHAMDPFP